MVISHYVVIKFNNFDILEHFVTFCTLCVVCSRQQRGKCLDHIKVKMQTHLFVLLFSFALNFLSFSVSISLKLCYFRLFLLTYDYLCDLLKVRVNTVKSIKIVEILNNIENIVILITPGQVVHNSLDLFCVSSKIIYVSINL